MNSPDPYDQDELTGLLCKILNDRIGKQKPPERVWTGIKKKLEIDKPWLGRFQRLQQPHLIMTALGVLLVILGGVSLQLISIPNNTIPLPVRDVLPAPTLVSMSTTSNLSYISPSSDEFEIRFEQTYLRRLSMHQAPVEPKIHLNDLILYDLHTNPVRLKQHLYEDEPLLKGFLP